MNLLHLPIQARRGLCGFQEPFPQEVGILGIEDLVLETCPEVQGNRSDLNLDRDLIHLVRKEHWDLYDQVEALVSIRLAVLNVVLDLKDVDVLLLHESLGHLVRVLNETADDPNTRDISHDSRTFPRVRTLPLRRIFFIMLFGLLSRVVTCSIGLYS